MNDKILQSVLSGRADNNINFSDFQNLIVDLGFEYKRQKGSHIAYRHMEHKINMNIQPEKNKAKGYQVKQLRILIVKYNLAEVK